METHIVPVVRQWKHIVNAQSACRVTTPTDDGLLPLVVLPNGGNASFCTNSSEVHVETDGIFEVVPFDHAQPPADRSYNPKSTNAQSGTAVAEAFSAGSSVEYLPDSPDAYTLKQGAAVQLSEYTETLQLTPSALTTAQEMRVLYTPAAARTTPLIALPDGVTLHWAGDEEPAWEAGKDYVIQLLQTAPTHIEARLFNAPQGAKLPEWMTDDARGYVAWSYDATGKRVPIAANVNGQLNGAWQFSPSVDRDAHRNIATEISSLLASAAFAEQTSGYKQFYGVQGDLALPCATFENETDASYQFNYSGRLSLPQATFEKVDRATYIFNGATSIYAPRASFTNLGSGDQTFMFGRLGFEMLERGDAWLNAFNPKTVIHTWTNQWFNMANGNFYFFSWKLSYYAANWGMFGGSGGSMFYLPVLTLSAQSDGKNCFRDGGGFYVPHLNLISLSSAPDFWRGKGGMSLDMLRQVVYGPKLVDGEPSATTYDDEEGIKQMIDPAEVQGERLYTNGNKKTGWGIRDFRVTDAAGEFVLDAEGNYTYMSTGHTIAFDAPATLQGDADYEACLVELENRGWVAELTYI